MNERNFDELQAICAKINNALKSKGTNNAQVMNVNQGVNAQEVQTRYARGYQAWLVDDYIAATEDFFG